MKNIKLFIVIVLLFTGIASVPSIPKGSFSGFLLRNDTYFQSSEYECLIVNLILNASETVAT